MGFTGQLCASAIAAVPASAMIAIARATAACHTFRIDASPLPLSGVMSNFQMRSTSFWMPDACAAHLRDDADFVIASRGRNRGAL
jgi:hypothetical protein